MRPIGGAELRDQHLDALLDGVLREDHRAGDLLVGVTLGHVAEQLELTRGQRLVCRFSLRRSIWGCPTWHVRRRAPARALRLHGLDPHGCEWLARLAVRDRG